MRMFLRSLLVLAITLPATTAMAQISSTFNSNADGWTAPDAENFAGLDVNGVPLGHLVADPFAFVLGAQTIFVPYYFFAPGKFTGNRSSYYNGTLRYDVQQSFVPTTPTVTPSAEVVLTSSAGVSIYYFPTTAFQPATPPTWTTFSVRLSEASGFWKTANDPSSAPATQAQITTILTSLEELEIRGLYGNANTIVRLDNVTLSEAIEITTQPQSAGICSGSAVTLTTAAENNPAITYRWQRETSPSVWTNISNGGGFTGATTSSLSITTSDSFGAGRYRCRISGTAVEDELTAVATVTVTARPAPPAATGAASCGPSALTLTATGGSAGQYRWFTVATGGSAVGGATSSSFTTPLLSASTTYYVAINNGTCVSTRTAVAADINAIPEPPLTGDGVSCDPGSVTLFATGADDGQFRWYDVAQGGNPLPNQVNGEFKTPSITTTTTYYAAINNGNCESARTPAVAMIGSPQCDNEAPVISATPLVTQIGGIIDIDLSTLISDLNENVDLSTLEIITPPSSGAPVMIDESFHLVIDYRNSGFAGKEAITLQVCDLFEACVQETFSIDVVGEIVVYNAFSPNGDGINPFFFLEHIEKLAETRRNRVTIFNRWGDVVWEGSDYDNEVVVFRGKSSNDTDLTTGIYFYTIDFPDGGTRQTGFLSLKR